LAAHPRDAGSRRARSLVQDRQVCHAGRSAAGGPARTSRADISAVIPALGAGIHALGFEAGLRRLL